MIIIFFWLVINDCLLLFFKHRYGGYTGVVPPDPISNSEVKYSKADDTCLQGK